MALEIPTIVDFVEHCLSLIDSRPPTTTPLMRYDGFMSTGAATPSSTRLTPPVASSWQQHHQQQHLPRGAASCSSRCRRQ
ncbi:hypothetical protein AAC387_Pa03g4651 [Persea americana]